VFQADKQQSSLYHNRDQANQQASEIELSTLVSVLDPQQASRVARWPQRYPGAVDPRRDPNRY